MFFIGQTHGQLKTIIRNLTKKKFKKKNLITNAKVKKCTRSLFMSIGLVKSEKKFGKGKVNSVIIVVK